MPQSRMCQHFIRVGMGICRAGTEAPQCHQANGHTKYHQTNRQTKSGGHTTYYEWTEHTHNVKIWKRGHIDKNITNKAICWCNLRCTKNMEKRYIDRNSGHLCCCQLSNCNAPAWGKTWPLQRNKDEIHPACNPDVWQFI